LVVTAPLNAGTASPFTASTEKRVHGIDRETQTERGGVGVQPADQRVGLEPPGGRAHGIHRVWRRVHGAVEEQGVAHTQDGAGRHQPLAVDGDGLGARTPQRIDHRLDILGVNDQIVDVARGSGGQVRVVEDDPHSGPVHRGQAGNEIGVAQVALAADGVVALAGLRAA